MNHFLLWAWLTDDMDHGIVAQGFSRTNSASGRDRQDADSAESSSGGGTSMQLHTSMSLVVLSQTVPLNIPLPVMILYIKT